ncbi:MAG TPA: hypothetical protein VMB34_27965 [Acetobacteraceae bacterium]|nr:hypothetical protein [Acetobacteraceae bacterium]
MGWVVLAPGTLQRITDVDFAEYARSDLVWPKVFLTGDGHRTPAFAWTGACPSVTDFFRQALAADRLYAYVEVRPSAVAANLVPGFLAALHGQGRVIGWELSLFEQLQPSMDKSLEVATLEIDLKRLDGIGPVLREFAALIDAVPEILQSNRTMDITTFDHVAAIMECLTTYQRRRAEFTVEVAKKLTNAAKNYFNACMGLRCSASYHQAVGDAIQRNMLQAPNSIHLIACGDNHLTCNGPLQQFIGLDALNALGWVDASHG